MISKSSKFTPFILIFPSFGIIIPTNKSAKVDFPEPDSPIMAVILFF